MTRSNIVEKTEADVIVQSPTKFFKPVFVSTPALPPEYDGKYVCLLGVATEGPMSEEQMDILEATLEALPEVYKAMCSIGPARIPLDRIPAGYDLKIGVEGKFIIEPIPVVEE